MEKKTPVLFAATMILLLAIGGCLEDDDRPEIEKLPPATQNGAQTLGCLVNGEAFVVSGPYFLRPQFVERTLIINGEELRGKEPDRFISIYVSVDSIPIGTYDITELPQSRGGYSIDGTECNYRTSADVRGTLTITYYNKSPFILSGTFEFNAYSENCQDTVTITHGRFDF